MLQERIKEKARQYADEFIGVRKHLHAHPELSYQEFETSKFVQAKLTSLGIPFAIKATTGILGTIEGKNPQGRVIALRADMDALPIQEENEVSYRSQHAGVMHACGHDVHTTCLLGAVKIAHFDGGLGHLVSAKIALQFRVHVVGVVECASQHSGGNPFADREGTRVDRLR